MVQSPRGANRAAGKGQINKWVVLIVGIFALAADLLSKRWALSSLNEGVRKPVIGSLFSLELVHNPGAAFSVGTGTTWIFTIISIAVLIVIVWFVVTGKIRDRVVAVLVGLIAGGAAGNLFDRLTRPPGFGSGHVVDFLNYNGWFVGNVADIWIVGGVAVLIIYLLFTDNKGESSE